MDFPHSGPPEMVPGFGNVPPGANPASQAQSIQGLAFGLIQEIIAMLATPRLSHHAHLSQQLISTAASIVVQCCVSLYSFCGLCGIISVSSERGESLLLTSMCGHLEATKIACGDLGGPKASTWRR